MIQCSIFRIPRTASKRAKNDPRGQIFYAELIMQILNKNRFVFVLSAKDFDAHHFNVF